MSDVWQGPGWWLAPDGKWYPADGGPDGDVDTSVIDTPVVDMPVVETPVVETPTSSGGGWQAAEPELDEDGATSEEGWTSGFTGEIPEVDAPESGHPVGAEAVPAASILTPSTPEPTSEKPTSHQAPDPIHRDDAWRKPNEDGLPLEVASTSRRAPEVVDLAVPQPVGTDSTVDDNNGASPVLLATGVIAFLLLAAVAINFLFFGDDDATDLNTDPETVTSAAPATTDEPTDTSDTSDDGTTTVDDTTTAEETTTSQAVPSEGVEISVFDLQAGDCIESEIGTGQVQKLIKVDCELAHEFEVYREALVDKTIETYDIEAIETQAQELCRASLAALIPEDDDRDLMYKWFQPTEQSWNQAGNPDRVITCLLFDENEKLFGTVG